jgi:hypothetical protein
MATKPQVIALEEHYLDPEVKGHIGAADRSGGPAITARLDDVGQGRLAEMDAAGIDIQVLSHGAPSVPTRDSRSGWRGAPTTASPIRCAPIPTASPALRCCRPPTRKPPPTNWSVR